MYHVAHQSFGQWFQQIGKNVEMPNFTQALYDARELAMERMQHEADTVGAEGIVGANIHESTHSWSSHVIEFLSVGTAITSTSPIIRSRRLKLPCRSAPTSIRRRLVHAAPMPPTRGLVRSAGNPG